MYRSVLVSLDGSLFAEHALPLALSVAQRAGATLNVALVHTRFYNGTELAPAATAEATLRRQQRAYLDGVVGRLKVASPLQVTSALLEGPVAEALHEHASATGTDLILLATHGRGPLSRFWLGSVADRLIRQLPAPALLVRPQEGMPDLAARPVLDRILLPLDGSELAEQILGPAAELGKLMGAEFTLLSVVEPVFVPDYHFGGNAVSGLDFSLLQMVQADAREYLEQVAEGLRGKSLRVQTRVVIDRPAAATILEEARTHAMNLIALATHGRGGLARLLMGSVADKVVRGAPTVVMVHRPR